jgi:hypothetical protein
MTDPNKSEKNVRDIAITGVAGILGGIIGVPLSILVFQGYKKLGLKGASRWWAWSATGVLAVPASWLITAALISPVSENNLNSQQPQSLTNASKETPKVVGSFDGSKFHYRNIRIRDYIPTNSTAAVAGKLIEVTADVTNISNESAAPSLESIKAVNEKGQKFKEGDLFADLGDIPKGKHKTDYVLPGQTNLEVRLAILDVPSDTSNVDLLIQEAIFGKETKVTPIK